MQYGDCFPAAMLADSIFLAKSQNPLYTSVMTAALAADDTTGPPCTGTQEKTMRTLRKALLTVLLAAALFPFQAAAQSKGAILIASEKTGFKDALVKEMESILSTAGYTVVTTRHSKKWLDKYQASDYAAVFITNSGVNSKVRPWVTEWIEKNRPSGAYILLHTTQIREWKVEASVDAVTSASTKNEVKSLARGYAGRIMARLEGTGTAQ